ncbi:MAG: dTDP-4-amino-4,6-dideoxygalactose transaminase [Alcanivoracaceae bacterium]|nr:dTDP-4-amino-4,6-dideoxygalactose transaminase [Alcanivoracaceae bacterium]
MNRPMVPFNSTYLSGQESVYLQDALTRPAGAGGVYSQRCEKWLENSTKARRVLLTHSCTNALELAAILLDLSPGDEVIVPSFTFTSTANAFALHGATIVFVDIRPDTLNIDERAIEEAITSRTRAIVPVHYAGIACNMHAIMDIADRYNILVIEDAAQGVGSLYQNKPLGTIGHLGCYSFHASKNITCGEGGALLINDERFIGRAEILHDKGTTRAQFRAGKIRQYDWVNIGTSAPPSELQAAYLLAQLEQAEEINRQRVMLWDLYQLKLSPLVKKGLLQHLLPPENCRHNAHIFGLIFSTQEMRNLAQEHLQEEGIQTALHYQPLHRSPAGQRLGRASGSMTQSEMLPDRLLRLPLWSGMPSNTIDKTFDILDHMLNNSQTA